MKGVVSAALGICLCIGVLQGRADAQQAIKVCDRVEVLTVTESAETGNKTLADPDPKIEVSTNGEKQGMMLTAYGPVLGSMDSPTVSTNVACTAKGIVFTATITRSSEFNGTAAQNVNWRPKITIEVVARRVPATVKAVWRMRLTTGAEIRHAESPPFPDKKYPIVVSKTISSLRGEYPFVRQPLDRSILNIFAHIHEDSCVTDLRGARPVQA